MASSNKSTVWIVIAGVGCGCLMLIAVGGIIAAIVIPNFLDAVQKAKQKRTIVDERTVATAFLAWSVDNAETTRLEVGSLSADQLGAMLVPDYIAELPTEDAWGHEFAFEITGQDAQGFPDFQIRSAGRDGVFERIPVATEAYPSDQYDRDIIWKGSAFLLRPGPVANDRGP